MQPTRRFWATALATLAALLAAVLLQAPAYLLVAAGITAWVVAVQVRFLDALEAIDAVATVACTVEPGRVVEDDPVEVSVVTDLPAVGGDVADVTCSLSLPVAVGDVDGTTARSVATGGSDVRSVTARIPVAGRHTFGRPSLTVTSPAGLFTEEITRGEERTVTVAPRRPRDIHVGEGGDRVAVAAGEHAAAHGRRSTEPAEIREYHSGDPADRIDWKATARLGEPFVREFEPRGERATVLVVDHRASTAVGREGERALDYGRELALAVAADAADNGDPLGLFAVGDDGATRELPVTAGPDQYQQVRSALRNLVPTGGDDGPLVETGPGEAARQATELDDSDAFGRTLAPFFEAGTYVQRLDEDPLFGTVRRRVVESAGNPWVVLVTTDRHRAEVRETVKLARRGNRRVTVFLAPTSLYGERALTDLEATYERYADFERFRRDLAELDGVTAFEVAPRERLVSVLEGHRHSQRGVGA